MVSYISGNDRMGCVIAYNLYDLALRASRDSLNCLLGGYYKRYFRNQLVQQYCNIEVSSIMQSTVSTDMPCSITLNLEHSQ